MKRAVLLSTLFVLLTSPFAQLHARDAGGDLPDNSSVAFNDDDDDEAFFSGGDNPAIASAPAAAPVTVRRLPKVDVVSTCQSVLSDDAGQYARRFYDACRVVVSQKPTRQASR